MLFRSALLMQNHRCLRPAIASHNLRSAARALALAERLELPQSAYELQMLYGMGDPIKEVFVRRGERLRIYTPFGRLLPGMAYLVRRLLENTSNTSFLRATFTEHTSIEELLRPPQDVAAAECKETAMPRRSDAVENLAPFANEPLTDFSREFEREQMRDALRRVQIGRAHV